MKNGFLLSCLCLAYYPSGTSREKISSVRVSESSFALGTLMAACFSFVLSLRLGLARSLLTRPPTVRRPCPLASRTNASNRSATARRRTKYASLCFARQTSVRFHGTGFRMSSTAQELSRRFHFSMNSTILTSGLNNFNNSI